MTILDPHLDVDQLSAAVDGEADPGTAGHLAACVACRTQVDAWRRALSPLRGPPTAGPTGVDPVVAALAAWDRSAPGRPAAEPTPRVPSPLSEAPASGRPARRPARWGRWPAPTGVAAALVAVVVLAGAVVGILVAGPGGSSSTARSAPSGARSSAAASAAPSAAGAAHPVAAPGGPRSQSAASSGGASMAATAGSATVSFAGPTQLAAALRRAANGFSTSVAADSPCLRQARRLAAGVPAVVTDSPSFTEAVDLTGVAGQVFVFTQTHGHVAVVLRSSTCSLLATVAF